MPRAVHKTAIRLGYEVMPGDMETYSLIVGVLLAVALTASYLRPAA